MKKLIPLFLLLSGCTPPVEQNGATVPTTEFRLENRLITLNHDGHRYVIVMDSNHPQAILHHPDCCKPAQ